MHKLAVNKKVIAKDTQALQRNTYQWFTEELTLEEIVRLSYYEGYAIAPATYANHQKLGNEWLSSSLFIYDIDSTDNPTLKFNDIVESEFVQKYATAVYASSSGGFDKPNCHIIVPADTEIKDLNTYKRIHEWISENLVDSYIIADISMGNGVQCAFGTGSKTGGSNKATFNKDDYIYTNYDVKPINVQNILMQVRKTPLDESTFEESISRNAQEHGKQTLSKQVNTTIEMLSVVLKGWGNRDYASEWLPIVFASYAGCNGDVSVMDYILNHPNVNWCRDSYKGKREFAHAWEKGTYAAEKYHGKPITVATLMYHATNAGWLSDSPIKLEDYTEIYADNISKWIQDLPDNHNKILLKSNTGTGKTWGAIDKLISMGVPQSVFFAPSIKLCVNLASRIRQALESKGLDSDVVTLYIEDGKTKDKEVLQNAHVLVTTLQTFANKVFNSRETRFDATQYKLVVVDESDKLITDFVTSGMGDGFKHLSSHVSKGEGFSGIKALRELVDKAKMVLFLDGTATKVSQSFLKRSTKDHVYTYVNTYRIRKAPIHMLYSQKTFEYLVIKAVDFLRVNQKKVETVVIACDTKRKAKDMYDLAVISGDIKEDDAILITRETKDTPKVSEFFGDIEAQSEHYKLIVYSPTMSSGVSIETVKADILLCNFSYLNPSDNLQMLNRFRKQGAVYVYRQGHRGLYTNYNDQKRKIEAQRQKEASYFNAEIAARSVQAKLTDDLVDMIAQHNIAERRDTILYLQSLLKEDNRYLQTYVGKDLEQYEKVRDIANDRIKGKNEEITEYALMYWRNHPPLDELEEDEHVNPKHLVASLMHLRIRNFLQDRYEPEEYLNLQIDDKELAMLVSSHAGGVYRLREILNFESYVDKTVLDIVQSNVPQSTLNLVYTRVEFLQCMAIVFSRNGESVMSITGDELDNKAEDFLRYVEARKSIYNAMFARGKRSNREYDQLCERHNYDDTKIAVSIIGFICDYYGLKKVYRKRENILSIEGHTDLLKLYDLKFKDDIPATFDVTRANVEETMKRARKQLNTIKALTGDNFNRINSIKDAIINISLQGIIDELSTPITA